MNLPPTLQSPTNAAGKIWNPAHGASLWVGGARKGSEGRQEWDQHREKRGLGWTPGLGSDSGVLAVHCSRAAGAPCQCLDLRTQPRTESGAPYWCSAPGEGDGHRPVSSWLASFQGVEELLELPFVVKEGRMGWCKYNWT